jgi:hypothetical protein
MVGTEALARIKRMAACYSEGTRFTSAADRDRHFTRDQQLAWLLRFGTPDEADAAEAEIFEGEIC